MEKPEIKTRFKDGLGAIEIRAAIDEQAFETLHQVGLKGLSGIMERSDKHGDALIVTYSNTTQDWLNSEVERVSAGFQQPEVQTIIESEEKAASELPRRAFRLAALLSTVLH